MVCISGLNFLMQPGSFFSNRARAAEELAVEADALEPVVQSELVGESDAAVHFGRVFSYELSDLSQMGLGMTGRQT